MTAVLIRANSQRVQETSNSCFKLQSGKLFSFFLAVPKRLSSWVRRRGRDVKHLQRRLTEAFRAKCRTEQKDQHRTRGSSSSPIHRGDSYLAHVKLQTPHVALDGFDLLQRRRRHTRLATAVDAKSLSANDVSHKLTPCVIFFFFFTCNISFAHFLASLQISFIISPPFHHLFHAYILRFHIKVLNQMPAHLVQIVKDPLKKENTDTNFQWLHMYCTAYSSLSSAKQFSVASKAS